MKVYCVVNTDGEVLNVCKSFEQAKERAERYAKDAGFYYFNDNAWYYEGGDVVVDIQEVELE